VPFNKSQIFTLSLQVRALTFTLVFWQHLFLERQIFTKLRAGKHSEDYTMAYTQLTTAQA
jgi:hypothetical protein